MSAGNPTIDELMIPVSKAIERHVKYPSDAFTDIYNRAYEAIQNSMDATREAQMDAERLYGVVNNQIPDPGDYINIVREKHRDIVWGRSTKSQ